MLKAFEHFIPVEFLQNQLVISELSLLARANIPMQNALVNY